MSECVGFNVALRRHLADEDQLGLRNCTVSQQHADDAVLAVTCICILAHLYEQDTFFQLHTQEG